ncbi:hypothetical protein OPV22_019711 [Ensete ventricosum]|uniref:Mediator-associated protein 2 n=1 Tax=Ensete ventricosum TaxID=4639 RepID=A0AAV8Q8B3_ENSVE|nr:hypothetical protein OPV22_019711 [Ensete ventricosum]
MSIRAELVPNQPVREILSPDESSNPEASKAVSLAGGGRAAPRRRRERTKSAIMQDEGYKPGPDFEEDSRTPLVDISLTDSTELWLIQWPINQLQPADFNGKELTLKLNRDGKLGGFESASGKSYDFVSFAAHEPDATVFVPSVSETKVVGKISRRVCLVHYPEPGELEKPRFSLSSQRTEGLSSQRTEGGSVRRSISRPSVTPLRHGSLLGTEGTSHDTFTSAYNPEERSMETPLKSRKRHAASTAPSEISARSADRSSHASGLESEITNNSLISDRSHREKSKKKKMVKLEE